MELYSCKDIYPGRCVTEKEYPRMFEYNDSLPSSSFPVVFFLL